MHRKLLQSHLALLLILAFAATLLPPVYANAGQSTQSARRGKNGSSTTQADSPPIPKNSPASPPAQTDDRKTTPDDNDADALPDEDTVKPKQSEKTGTPNDSRKTPAASSSTQSSSKKPEPPPFDRPPMNPDSTSAASPSATATRSAQPPATTTGERSSGSTRSAPTYSNNSPSRSNDPTASSTSRSSGPPVLHRPTASDSRTGSSRQDSSNRENDDSVFSNDPNHSSSRNRSDRPVLRRSGDQPDQESTPNSTRPSDSRGNPPAANQESGGDGDQVVKLESTLVNIPLMVSDRSGRYIPQLTKNDFVLYEDGVQQEIASFGSEEVPFNVALLLDVSPSVEGNADSIQEAALAFVRQLRPQDRVMVVSFDRQIHYLTDFTNNRQQLEWAIRSTRIGSGTSVYDAVYEVVARRLRNVEGRKAMILFSDGDDTTSNRASYDDAVSIVTESDVLVYGLRYPGNGGGGGILNRRPWPRSPVPNFPFPLPFPWPMPRRRGPFHLMPQVNNGMVMNATGGDPQWRRHGGIGGGGDFMKDITEAGGGPVYDAEHVGDMSRLAERIADELRHVYVLSYYPKNALSNGGYRAIRIRVKGRDDIAVRHRRGYNAGTVNSPSHTE